MKNHQKPRIGITTRIPPLLRSVALQDYRKAVREAGGIPVVLNQGDDARAWECQGLIFSGGVDIHPSQIPGHSQDAGLSDAELAEKYQMTTQPARDAFELPLARKALISSIPVLGICRGFQTLNIAAGGGLILHLPDWSTKVCHRYKSRGANPGHTVEIARGSNFAAVTGAGETAVNTYHHQGITDVELAPGLKAVAYAGDGLIEALEKPGRGFFFAVQWHPERSRDAAVKERFRMLFEELISAARTG